MVSRIRSSRLRVEDVGAEYDQHGHALMDLVVKIVAHKPDDTQSRAQDRILARFAMAMMAALRGARREKSKAHLRDLIELDDAQFERVLEGLRYMRDRARQLPGRRKRADQAH